MERWTKEEGVHLSAAHHSKFVLRLCTMIVLNCKTSSLDKYLKQGFLLVLYLLTTSTDFLAGQNISLAYNEATEVTWLNFIVFH